MNEVKHKEKFTINKQLDIGGPLLLSTGDEENSKALLIDTLICDDPECQCCDIYIDAYEYDYTDENKDRKYSEIKDNEELFQFCLNINNGELTIYEESQAGPAYAALLLRLDKHIKENDLMNIFRKRWNYIKKINMDSYKNKDWSAWIPGDMIGWYEVFPDTPDLFYEIEDTSFFLDDQYCVTPGCGCSNAVFAMVSINGERSETLGAIYMNIKKWQVTKIDSKTLSSKKLKELWSKLNTKYPNLKGTLKERKDTISKAMHEVLQPFVHKEKTESKKTGRNDPCPCGSGKKYKKCCITD